MRGDGGVRGPSTAVGNQFYLVLRRGCVRDTARSVSVGMLGSYCCTAVRIVLDIVYCCLDQDGWL